MVVVWRGAGLFTAGFYFISLIAVNLDIFINYNRNRFEQINWWLPALLTAILNAWVVNLANRMDTEATPQTYVGRLFLYLGKRHHIFWIPLRYWTVILLVFGLVGLWQTLFPSAG